MFRLALALGFPHPRFLVRVLSSQDITDWMAFAACEPFGGVREDERIGTLTSLVYNGFMRGKGELPARWYQFFPNAEMPEVPVGAAEVDPDKASDNLVNMLTAFFGEAKKE